MKELIGTQKEENEKSKNKLKAKEKELVTMKSELESKDSNLASLEAEIRDDIEAARTPTVTASESNASSNENSSNESNNSSDNSSDGDLRTLSQSEPTGKDRKSTRLNSSHVAISYAVFCLKKKKTSNTYRKS